MVIILISVYAEPPEFEPEIVWLLSPSCWTTPNISPDDPISRPWGNSGMTFHVSMIPPEVKGLLIPQSLEILQNIWFEV